MNDQLIYKYRLFVWRHFVFILFYFLINGATLFSQNTQKITPEIQKILNDYYFAQEKGDAAMGLAALNKLIKADSLFAPYYSARASLRIFAKDTNYVLIMSDLSSAILLDTGNLQYYLERVKYTRTFNDEENYAIALSDCRKILSMDSTYFPAYEQLHIYYSNRNPKEAKSIRKKALSVMQIRVQNDPVNAENWYYLGKAYDLVGDEMESKGDKQSALDAYNKAISIDSSKYIYFWERAKKNYWFKKDYARCVDDLSRILSMTDAPVYYLYLSMCFEKVHDYKKAEEMVTAGLSVYPADRELLEQKSNISKKVKSGP